MFFITTAVNSSYRRNSNLELLRIIAMFLIVQSHFAVHGYMAMVDGNLISIENGFNRFIVTLMTTGNIGNGLFMLITGYFLSNSLCFNVNRLINVVAQVIFYSILCYIYFTYYWGGEFLLNEFFVALTPLIHDTYWYFSSYVLILLFSPFINILIMSLSQRKLGILICLTELIWGVIPSLTGLQFQGSGFLRFCIFYLVGAYIRKYYVIGKGFQFNDIYLFSKDNVKRLMIILILIWVVISILTSKFTPLYRMVYIGSPIIFLLDLFVFIYFINMQIWVSHCVNSIAGCVAGVYLLSDNPYIRSIMYTKFFHVEKIIDSNAMLLYTILYVAIVYVVCIIIELVRCRIGNYLRIKMTNA